jgi:hypothetical protein
VAASALCHKHCNLEETFKIELKQVLIRLKQGLIRLKQGLIGLKQGLIGLKQGLIGLKQGLIGLKQGLIGLKHVLGCERGQSGAGQGTWREIVSHLGWRRAWRGAGTDSAFIEACRRISNQK